MSYAETDDERLIAPASIRSELNVGRSKGKYVDIDGQWNLAGDGGSDEAEDQSMEVQTSASSDHDHNGGRSNAAALVSDPDR